MNYKISSVLIQFFRIDPGTFGSVLRVIIADRCVTKIHGLSRVCRLEKKVENH